MSLLGNEPQDEATRQDNALVDAYARSHFFGAEPPDDAPAAEPGQPEPSEDQQFDAYMAAYFPGRTPPRG